MNQRALYWIWVRGNLRGPFHAWEIGLIRSKERYFPVFDSVRGWLDQKGWSPCADAEPRLEPDPPALPLRVRLRIRHLVARRLLCLFH